MNQLINGLKVQQEEIEKIIKEAERCVKKAPDGALRIIKNHNTIQYYVKNDPMKPNGTYLAKKNTKMIQALAQKEYAQRVLSAALEQRKIIEKFVKGYSPNVIKQIYQRLSDEKQSLILPYIQPDDQYADNWEHADYERKSFARPEDVSRQRIEYNNEIGIYTEKGERVRSKSEKMIADKFMMKGIPYRYEAALLLKGYGNVYPDFTVLNPRTREEYYWEHLGILDNQEYCEKSILKIESYIRNKIYPGEKLILSFETSNHPLNMKIVDHLIEKYFGQDTE